MLSLLIEDESEVTGQEQPTQFSGFPASNSTYVIPNRIGEQLNNTPLDFTAPSSSENYSSTKSAIYVMTNRPNYIIGQQIQIFVWIYDPTSNQTDLNIEAKHDDRTIYSSAALVPTNKRQDLTGPNTDSEGIYNITVRTTVGSTDQVAWVTIKVTSLFTSVPSFFLYISMVFFGGLSVLIIRGTKSHSISEIIRFICITGIVLSVLASLLLTDLQIGSNSPVGLVIRTNQSDDIFADWALNIGGSPLTNFADGIVIPVYVIVFGLIGGYLRYLYKTARLRSVNSPLRKILLFSWENVPGTDSDILRNFLREKFDINWISSQEFVKSQDNLTLTLSNRSSVIIVTLCESKS
jgi:hypothetical protein